MKARNILYSVIGAFVLLISIQTNAQIYPKPNEKGKFGYVDSQGKVIMDFKLDRAGYLNNGIALFCKGGKWGFINAEGKVIVEPKYYAAGNFNEEGYCWVCSKGKVDKNQQFVGEEYGVINREGKEIVPARFAHIGTFCMVAEGGQYVLYNPKKHKEPSYAPVDTCAIKSQLYTTWFAVPGSELPLSSFPYFWFSEGGNRLRPGLADTKGNVVLPCDMFERVFAPSDNMVLVSKLEKRKNEVLYYNMEKKKLLDTFIEGAAYYSFNENVAKVEVKGKGYCFINKRLKTITPYYKSAGEFVDGLCPVMDKNDKCGVIDTLGNTVIDFVYDSAKGSFSEGVLWVKKEFKWGAIDAEGKEVFPFEFGNVENFDHGWAAVQRPYLWGYIDRNGNEMVPCKWNSIQLVKRPLPDIVWVQAQNKGKWNAFVVETQQLWPGEGYDNVTDDGESEHIFVNNGDCYGVIDRKGNVIIPIEMGSREQAMYALSYTENILKKESLEGIDLYRFKLYISSAVNDYSIEQGIPNSMWDY